MKTADEVEREALRSFGHVLLGGFRYDPLLLALLKQFLTDEAIDDLIPDWMFETKKEEKNEQKVEAKPAEPEAPPTPEARATKILAMAEEQRIEALWESGVELVKSLIAEKRLDLVLEIVKVVVNQALSIAVNIRLKGAKLMGLLYPLMVGDEFAEARTQIEVTAEAAMMMEQEKTIYPALADLASDMIETMVLNGKPDQAAPILDTLRKQQLAEVKDFPERRDIALKSIEKVTAGKAFPIILEKIRAKSPVALRMVEALGMTAVRSLIERMKTSDSVAERMDLAQLILKAGSDAGTMLAEEALQVKAPSEALKLLDLIPHAMTDTQAEVALGTLLRHPALAVRRRAASFLGGRGYPRAGYHLVDALKKEADPSARALFVETIGLLKFDPGLAILGQILLTGSESEEVRCLAAVALGILSKTAAIPLLTRAAAKGKGLTLVLNPAPTAVRAAAVRALANYIRYPEGRDAIKRSLEDPDPPVREAARESMVAPMTKVFGDRAKKALIVTGIEAMAEVPQGGVTGLLSDVPLDQLCQTLDEGSRTGLLMLNVGGSNAEVYIDKGNVVSSEYNGLRGKPAFVQFCRWEGQYFLYLPGLTPSKPGPPTSLMRMVLEACDVGGGTAVRPRPGTAIRPRPPEKR
jgi:HEAT repeat protein